MNDETLSYIASIVREQFGWDLPEDIAPVFASKVDAVIRDKSLSNYQELVELIKSSDKSIAYQILESLSFSKTNFIFSESNFNIIYSKILPYIINKNKHKKSMNILSLGCSSGQEVYSIAISLKEILEDINEWDIELIGVDISADCIVKAQTGSYSTIEVQNGLDAKRLMKHFSYKGDYWQIEKSLIDFTSFRRLNIFNDSIPNKNYDLVICRNTLGVFAPSTQVSILSRLFNKQDNDSFLCLAPGENNLLAEKFYRKVPKQDSIYIKDKR